MHPEPGPLDVSKPQCIPTKAQMDPDTARKIRAELEELPHASNQTEPMIRLSVESELIREATKTFQQDARTQDRVVITFTRPIKFKTGTLKMERAGNGPDRGLVCLSETCELPDGAKGKIGHGYRWRTDERMEWTVKGGDFCLPFSYKETGPASA